MTSTTTVRLATTESILVLDTRGVPVLELELRANGVAVRGADGTRLAFLPVAPSTSSADTTSTTVDDGL